MEYKLAEYARHYNFKGLRMDLKQDELMDLSFNNHPDLLPLDDRLVKAHEELKLGLLKFDKNPLLNITPSLMKPLAFYNSYVTISALDREAIANDNVLSYYKCVIQDLSEENAHLKSQLKFMVEDETNVVKLKEKYDEQIKKLEFDFIKQRAQTDQAELFYEQQIHRLKEDAINETREIKAEG